MAKLKSDALLDLKHLAHAGREVNVRVTPKARRDSLSLRDGTLRVTVTAPPEDGKANEAVRKLLARAMGIAPSRLHLRRGQTARDKTFVCLEG
ncbi:DUF167 domain-containing protein [Ruegeria marina]|uniref:UPF0235 protein SAMN04488239_10561 n=1 Tax=Ruegeria marina TaxID=639004 RepID=A0A1G6RTA6_9RHOB|nr:DUF167 domain-containing protein [Ruegeria marina]SDD07634.1 hypothetical protein SAMN04488239_10561 [Ruegeria marina]